jgi:ribosome-binding factor A
MPSRTTNRGEPPQGARARALCAQARDALSLALASARDARLEDASILDVFPHPDASCLLVAVAAPEARADDVRAALAEGRSWLRREVASEIHRSRAPELVFRVVASTDELG